MSVATHFRLGMRIMQLCLVLFGGVALTVRDAAASTGLNAAAANAEAGLGACSSSAGKALYDCVANVLDKMSSETSRMRTDVSQTSRALAAAASGLRSAVNKVQALSAISQCRSVIAGALRQVKASGGQLVPGFGDTGLNAIAAVLAHAAQLIQTKG